MAAVGDFSFSPRGRVVLAVTSVQLLRGVGQQHLHVQVQLSASWIDRESKDVSLVLITGQLFNDQPGMSPIGSLSTLACVVRGYQTHENLYVSLSDEQVVALDTRRKGADLTFLSNIQITLLGDQSDSFPIAEQQMSLRIERGAWLAQLDSLGTEFGITIRVPTPLIDGDAVTPSASQSSVASAAQAGARLRQARDELRDARYERCIATCRQVLENLELIAGPVAHETTSKHERSLDERWVAVVKDMKSLTSAAHHDDDVTRDFVWTRSDAESTLAIVAAIAARALRA